MLVQVILGLLAIAALGAVAITLGGVRALSRARGPIPGQLSANAAASSSVNRRERV